MSKNCEHKVPCGCGDQPLTTPPPCNTGTPECPTPDPCPETFCAGCVVYCGDTIVDLGINQGDRMDVITQMLSLYLTNPGCITPPADPTAITALTIANAGVGYPNDGVHLGVLLTGGTGSGATADVTITGGIITGLVITNPGTGYSEADVLSLDTALPGVPTTPAELTVTVLPCRSTLGLHSTAITSSTVALAWLPDPSAVNGYQVEYKLATATSWTLSPAVAQAVNPIDTIGGLLPDTDYHIRVNTRCASGGCYSVTILVRTKQ